MQCPRCKSDLIVVEFDDIELDSCPECGGLWFDRGEMEPDAAPDVESFTTYELLDEVYKGGKDKLGQ